MKKMYLVEKLNHKTEKYKLGICTTVLEFVDNEDDWIICIEPISELAYKFPRAYLNECSCSSEESKRWFFSSLKKATLHRNELYNDCQDELVEQLQEIEQKKKNPFKNELF